MKRSSMAVRSPQPMHCGCVRDVEDAARDVLVHVVELGTPDREHVIGARRAVQVGFA